MADTPAPAAPAAPAPGRDPMPDHVLGNMLPEEIEAMNSESPTDELLTRAVEAPPEPAAPTPAAAPAAPGAPAAPAAPAPAAAGGEPAAAPAAPSMPAEREPFMPRLEAEDPAEVDKRIAELDVKGKLNALREKRDAGDITADDYDAERDAIRAEEQALLDAKRNAEFARKANEDAVRQRWEWTIESFLDTHKEYREKPMRFAALDVAVKALGNDEANSGKPMSWFLQEAHKLVEAEFTPGAPAPTPTPAAPGAAPAAPAPAAPALASPRVPTTLANVPPAAPTPQNDGEFAHLDSLGGEELEYAVAKLTPAQRERYLR